MNPFNGATYRHADGRHVVVQTPRIVKPLHAYYYAVNSGIGVDTFLEYLLPYMGMTPDDVAKQAGTNGKA